MKLKIMREIPSSSILGKKYTVRLFEGDFGEDIWMCNCPAFLFHKTECNHIKQAKLSIKIQRGPRKQNSN